MVWIALAVALLIYIYGASRTGTSANAMPSRTTTQEGDGWMSNGGAGAGRETHHPYTVSLSHLMHHSSSKALRFTPTCCCKYFCLHCGQEYSRSSLSCWRRSTILHSLYCLTCIRWSVVRGFTPLRQSIVTCWFIGNRRQYSLLSIVSSGTLSNGLQQPTWKLRDQG